MGEQDEVARPELVNVFDVLTHPSSRNSEM